MYIIDEISIDKQGRILLPPFMRDAEYIVFYRTTEESGIFISKPDPLTRDLNAESTKYMPTAKPDKKGRVSVPAGFRKLLPSANLSVALISTESVLLRPHDSPTEYTTNLRTDHA